jgi:TrmH family RNA methyltransferase
MQLTKISKLDVPELELYKTLRDNKLAQDNSFIADSPKVVNLLLENGIQAQSILATQEYYDSNAKLLQDKEIEKLYVCEKELMESIVGHTIHHNCMMHASRPTQTPLEELGKKVIMLDGITSAQNVGSIARSMAGLGVNSYLVPHSSPHPYSRRALRVSMGYMSHLCYNIYEDIFTTIRVLKQRGYKIVAAELSEKSISLHHIEVPQKWALILGHEGKGIDKKILDICDEVVSIDMQEGVKSLNVAVAASLIMYQYQTKAKG